MTDVLPVSTAPESSNKSSSPTAPSLAWLVHSQDSISRSLPPDIDDKPLVRQKRRRTSPEDQKILEEEFQRNPRPDKYTRRDIVKRVALGEKEVQIWFQNRRQNSRRKTQPLSADELVLLSRLNGSSDSLFPSSDGIEERAEHESVSREKPAVLGASLEQHASKKPSISPLAVEEQQVPSRSSDPLQAATQNETSQASLVRTASSTSLHASNETLPTEPSSSQHLASSQDSATSSFTKTGYLANRRSASFAQIKTDSTANEQKPEKRRSLERSSSLRLSMTSDGAAKVINPFSPSPSPPRSQPSLPLMAPPLRTGSLRRSYSAAGFADKIKQAEDGLFTRKVQRTSSGRSRDSRAWEFWCDSEARNSLTEKAAQESSGSAADAIGLIRTNSKSAAMRVAENRKKEIQARRDATTRKRPGFSRANTIAGRPPSDKSAPKVQSATSSKAFDSPSESWEQHNADSDKENWEPANNGSAPQRRRALGPAQPRQADRTVLGESQTIPSHNSSLAALMSRDRNLKLSNSHGEPKAEIDAEVAAFMGQSHRSSAGSRKSGSAEDDLDCIQGLLSLSKGAWA